MQSRDCYIPKLCSRGAELAYIVHRMRRQVGSVLAKCLESIVLDLWMEASLEIGVCRRVLWWVRRWKVPSSPITSLNSLTLPIISRDSWLCFPHHDDLQSMHRIIHLSCASFKSGARGALRLRSRAFATVAVHRDGHENPLVSI